jgi:hypothetical protein
MGSCFFHPRERHLSLGIMNVHPNYFGRGVARAMLQYILDEAQQKGFPAVRLIQSAMNLDSFSLYTRAGFVPRCAYQDMLVAVPEAGFPPCPPDTGRVRAAASDDAMAMAALERELAGIGRENDYRYFLENRDGFWNAWVCQSDDGSLDGFLVAMKHPALNMLGPGVMRSAQQAGPLIAAALDRYRGGAALFLVPAECQALVQQMYGWGARNCELHFCQVRGEFQPLRGVTMPTFLPESG